MGRPAAEEVTINGRKAWVSKPRPLKGNTIRKISTVFYPDTGETVLVQRSESLGVFNDIDVDIEAVIAKKDSAGEWEPVNDLVKNSIEEDPDFVASLNSSVDETVKTIYSQKNDGNEPTANQIESIKNGTETNLQGGEDNSESSDNKDPDTTKEDGE